MLLTSSRGELALLAYINGTIFYSFSFILSIEHPSSNLFSTIMTYYNISVSFRGDTHTVLYWPEGYGVYYSGYATSFGQLRRAVCKYFGVNNLKLYVNNGWSKQYVSTERQLRQELCRIGFGCSLHLSASELATLTVDTPWLPKRTTRSTPVRARTRRTKLVRTRPLIPRACPLRPRSRTTPIFQAMPVQPTHRRVQVNTVLVPFPVYESMPVQYQRRS